MRRPAMNAQQVIEARQLYRTHKYTIATLARRFGVSYTVMYSALRGFSWRSVQSEPPIAPEEVQRPQRFCENPKCGALIPTGRHKVHGECSACQSYRYRNKGRQRDPDAIKLRRKLTTKAEVLALYALYQEGQSTRQLAASRPYSDETIRRRFKEHNLPRRPGYITTMDAESVLLARWMYHVELIKGTTIAAALQLPYVTVMGAINGKTWPHLRGPTSHNGKCQHCGLLAKTAYCAYCTAELRDKWRIDDLDLPAPVEEEAAP